MKLHHFFALSLLLSNPFIAPIHLKAQQSEQTLDQQIKTYINELFAMMNTGLEIGYINEKGVSQLGHGLQAAQTMMEKLELNRDDLLTNFEKAEPVFAALFHDIGHLCAPEDAPQMDGDGVQQHELFGKNFLLARGFSERVGDLVEAHANAKRYLSTIDRSYYENLSPASKRTFEYQGGFMTPEEILLFEAHPNFEFRVLVRYCDEAAKNPHARVHELGFYYEPLFNYLKQQLINKSY